jgi:hypothetical protein
MVCVDLVGPFTIRTSAKTHPLLSLTIIDSAIKTEWFKIFEPTNDSATPTSRICFITHECIQEWYNKNPKRQNEIISERVNICGITPFNPKPN